MRIPLIALASGVLSVLVVTGSAAQATSSPPPLAAAPSGLAAPAPPAAPAAAAQRGFPTVLTKNRLYRSGAVDSFTCSPGEPRAGSANSLKTYLLKVARCVNLMYARQFKAAGMSYRVPKIVIRATGARTPCGKLTNTYTAHYCTASQTIYQILPKSTIRNPWGLTLAKTMAHEIGHHAQQRAGIVPAFNQLYAQARTKTARNYLNHRVEQQAECMAGVFLGSVQESLPVVFEEWDQVVDWAAKHATDTVHGKGRNQAFWLERGYDSQSFASCNTWSAPNARVA
ncbi:neutral zinc metallopeptidase [Herbidospora mongoliensis]|uniref:neutral zinc metallopeptidase n=1 Tax=Herbidospora mongoliensis TaxID=688067 RepID=UPI0012F7A8BD|nr:neutral zinc metallopeptidase [Herbidospora mongoliensis]